MLDGNGSNISDLEVYINQYKDGKEILSIIGKDKIADLILKIKTDCAQGAPLNNPFSNAFL